MEFIADLHVHSRFSRATAKNLDLENLYVAAQIKGVRVVGTGDFTHPAWLEEITCKLEPAEPGLFKLKQTLAQVCDLEVPPSCRAPVRFLLATEISNIYKKDDFTRKNHNLVFVPDMDTAARFSYRLDAIGNINSDGRPILGLDARNLLEVLLETSEDAFLIPAHIWTPWFSLLGSKSGFDSVDACFGDLSGHIFAAETGLSSDPAMNWRVSFLDGLTLVSNSDAHSPANLGREANMFSSDLSYFAIRDALRDRRSGAFLGTIEFYPEEGKYHLDGHRNCQVRLRPEQTFVHQGKCPVCQKPLTVGVLSRVEELADRAGGQKPEVWFPFENLLPMRDILAQVLNVGPKTKRVASAYRTIIETLGSELVVLRNLDIDAIDRAGVPLLGEAVRRMRTAEIHLSPGYDGEYGRVTIFSETERQRLLGQQMLFSIQRPEESTDPFCSVIDPPAQSADVSAVADEAEKMTIVLNDDQRRAVEHPDGPMLIVAGPGTGKTRTLTARIAHLIQQRGVPPESILAVTFTNKAAEEMHSRLQSQLMQPQRLPVIATFHGLCYRLLNEKNTTGPLGIVDEGARAFWMGEAVDIVVASGTPVPFTTRRLTDRICAFKQQMLGPDDIIRKDTYQSDNGIISLVYRAYQKLLGARNLMDYEDLIFKLVRMLESDEDARHIFQERFRHIFVDEYQDLNQGQYRILRALMPEGTSRRNLCAIGDPDQAIYGFRGSDVLYFNRFLSDYPQAVSIRLERNYRSTQTILDASHQLIAADPSRAVDHRVYSHIAGHTVINVIEAATDRAEAEMVGRLIETMIGGTGFHSVDTGAVDTANLDAAKSYADFAVLFRTNEQSRTIAQVFEETGIPFQLANRRKIFEQEGVAALLAVLRLVEGIGSQADLDLAFGALMPGLPQKTLAAFRDWRRQNNLAVGEGLQQAERFPIPAVSPRNQLMIAEFSRELEALRERMRHESTFRKLLVLSERLPHGALFSRKTKDPLTRDHLAHLADAHQDSAGDFLAAVALDTDTDIYAPQAERVALMTMHAAKGLEFPVVFVTGCEKNLLPLARASGEPAAIEEERRLFYVAMTRAKERLFLSHARRRRVYGRCDVCEVSPFVADIATHLLARETTDLSRKKKDLVQRQLKLF